MRGAAVADPGQLGEIAKVAAGSVGGGAALVMIGKVVAGLLQGWLNGTDAQEKELRGGMSEEIKTLRAELRSTREECRQEIEELRGDVRRLTRMYLHVLTTRAEARAGLNALEKVHSLPVTTWPDDPSEHMGGGTP